MRYAILFLMFFFSSLGGAFAQVQASEQLKKIVPSYRDQVDETELLKQDQSTFKQEFTILGRSENIFPKTQTSTTVNPIFKGNRFEVEAVKKQDKNFNFAPDVTRERGINDTFATKRKPIDEKEIPQELRDLFKKNKQKNY